MSDQPERIWATQYMQANAPFSGGVQYIRADVVEAMVAAERERCARVVGDDDTYQCSAQRLCRSGRPGVAPL